MQSVSAITPAKFRARVAGQFLDLSNLEYLRGLFRQQVPAGPLRNYMLGTLRDAAQEFAGGSSAGDSRALDEVATDPIAQRGALRPALDLWAEVRRLNLIFFNDRMAFLRDNAGLITQGANQRFANANMPARKKRIPDLTHGIDVHDGGHGIDVHDGGHGIDGHGIDGHGIDEYEIDGHEGGHGIDGPPVTRDGLSEDNEQYHMRMFISDSLQPPGLENLNGPGPSWAILEDQSSWLHEKPPRATVAQRAARPLAKGVRPAESLGSELSPGRQTMLAAAALGGSGGRQQADAAAEWQRLTRVGAPRETRGARRETRVGAPRETRGARRETFVGAPQKGEPTAPHHETPRVSRSGARTYNAPGPAADYVEFGVNPADAPWRVGQVNRTPEAAVAEYWGDNWSATDTQIGATEQAGVAYGAADSWGDGWRENGGTRFMRYESIPFWQKGGRVGYDYDIEETLGTAGRELDSNVRRWDMERVRTDTTAQQSALAQSSSRARVPASARAPYPYLAPAPYPAPAQYGRYFGTRSGGNV